METRHTTRILAMVLTAACRLVIATTGLRWLEAGNLLWTGVAAVALAMTLLPSMIFRRSPVRDAASAVLAALLGAHVALGMDGGLYETSATYDKWIHGIGSAALAGLGSVVILRRTRRHQLELPLSVLTAIVLTCTLSFGTLWELFEFGIDRTGHFTAQRGLDDTMLDLVANTTGALVASGAFAAAVAFRRRGTRTHAGRTDSADFPRKRRNRVQRQRGHG